MADGAARHRAREAALQMLYQWEVGRASAHVFKNLGYDPLRDYVPVASVVNMDFGLVASAAAAPGIKTLREYVQWVKAHPNESNYGLNGSVLTSDVQAAYDISRRIRTGVMGQNGMRMEFGMPFGGFKQSGIGREGGEEGLWPYLETKTILLDGAPDRL